MIKATFELNGNVIVSEVMDGAWYQNGEFIRAAFPEISFAVFARGMRIIEATPQALSIIRKHNG